MFGIEPSTIWVSSVEGSGLDIGPSVIWGVIVDGSGVWHWTIHDIGLLQYSYRGELADVSLCFL